LERADLDRVTETWGPFIERWGYSVPPEP
jgi:hypothetical protein